MIIPFTYSSNIRLGTSLIKAITKSTSTSYKSLILKIICTILDLIFKYIALPMGVIFGLCIIQTLSHIDIEKIKKKERYSWEFINKVLYHGLSCMITAIVLFFIKYKLENLQDFYLQQSKNNNYKVLFPVFLESISQLNVSDGKYIGYDTLVNIFKKLNSDIINNSNNSIDMIVFLIHPLLILSLIPIACIYNYLVYITLTSRIITSNNTVSLLDFINSTIDIRFANLYDTMIIIIILYAAILCLGIYLYVINRSISKYDNVKELLDINFSNSTMEVSFFNIRLGYIIFISLIWIPMMLIITGYDTISSSFVLINSASNHQLQKIIQPIVESILSSEWTNIFVIVHNKKDNKIGELDRFSIKKLSDKEQKYYIGIHNYNLPILLFIFFIVLRYSKVLDFINIQYLDGTMGWIKNRVFNRYIIKILNKLEFYDKSSWDIHSPVNRIIIEFDSLRYRLLTIYNSSIQNHYNTILSKSKLDIDNMQILSGFSGSGKSSLITNIIGISNNMVNHKVTAYDIYGNIYENQSHLIKNIILFPQEVGGISDKYTLYEVADYMGITFNVQKTLLLPLMNCFGLGHIPLNRLYGNISGGQKRRLNFLMSICNFIPSKITYMFILDEMKGLDNQTRNKIIKVLTSLNIIQASYVSHNISIKHKGLRAALYTHIAQYDMKSICILHTNPDIENAHLFDVKNTINIDKSITIK